MSSKIIQTIFFSKNQGAKKIKHANRLIVLTLIFGFVFIIFAAFDTVSADQFTIYVNAGGNDAYDGQSAIWNGTSGPKSTIKNATDTVLNGGTINIANGVYTGTGNVNIPIKKNMTIVGQSKTGTIINGANSGPIFGIQSGENVIIQNLTFENGSTVRYSTGYGGAIDNNGNLIVNNCIFTDNMAESVFYTQITGYGGAIYNSRGTLTVTDSIFTGNKAWYGGAIYSSGPLTVKRCTFTGNTAVVYNATSIINGGIVGGNGGAIYNGGTSTITGNTFVGNTANTGGAIWNTGTLNVHFNRIVGNTASYGNAIYNNADGTTVNATLNWWGSNANPSGRIFGNVNVSKWLILTLTANMVSIKTKGTSTIKADILHDSQGGYHDPASGHVPDGIPVNFVTSSGAIGDQSSTINGIAQSILNGVPVASVTTVSAKIDNQNVTKILDTIPPKVAATSPKNGATGVSRTATISIKLSENILKSIKWSEIYIKNMKTGAKCKVTTWISGNHLYIKTNTKRAAYTSYQVYIPASSVKDSSGNNLAVTYAFKFKTGKY